MPNRQIQLTAVYIKKLTGILRELDTYVFGQFDSIINYAAARRSGGLRNLKSGNFEFACSRILAFPFDVGLGLGDPIVVDLDQHGADKSD